MQVDSLQRLVSQANVEVRALEASAAEKGAQAAGGMSGVRFAQARERLMTWYSEGAREKHRFPDAKLLFSRKGELDQLRAAF